MAPENDTPVADVADGTPDVVDATKPATSADAETSPAAEKAEAEPQLDLTVHSSCKNPVGRYVGLNGKQREALGVVEGSTVELFDGVSSLGFFTVGKGLTELVGKPEFTVNGVAPGTKVVVKKASDKRETLSELSVKHGIENVPGELKDEAALAYADRTVRRMGIIAERFQGVDSGEFMTVPTAVVNMMIGQVGAKTVVTTPTKAAIMRGKIRFAGKETPMIVVPSGSEIGFTTKAAAKLGIPEALKTIRFRIDKGVLVID